MVIKTIYEENELVCVYTEEEEGNLFLHVEVKKWSKSVYIYIKLLWKQMQGELWFEGWDRIYTYTESNRFVKWMDPEFKLLQAIEGTDIKLYYKDLEV